MATNCRKCGESLLGSARFCASCGAPVPAASSTLESKAFTPPAVRTSPIEEAPPTRASVPSPDAAQSPSGRGSGYGPPPPPANPVPQPAPSAPQAWPASTPYGAPAPSYPQNAAAYQPAYPQPQGYAPAAPGYAPYAPQAGAPYAPAFVAGARVLVQWADGNRYPGIVQQVAPAQCLIVFPDGQQRWVEYQYLTLAR
ncbi:MAG: zinc-ribbon domain-containing protein [Polyangiaceae bacterium]